MTDFTHFVGVDWSGAKGKRHAGIAVAVADESHAMPKLIVPPSGNKHWSRQECADWIASGCGLPGDARLLIGFDSSFSIPYVDDGSYLPGLSVESAEQLWAEVEHYCAAGADLFGGPFVDAFADCYHKTGAKGARYRRRMRVAEALAVKTGMGPCESVFHLIGPSQVGLSGLSTIRLLHKLKDRHDIAVWPFDEHSEKRIVVVEIYAAAFASMGGVRGKIRDRKTLLTSLQTFGHEGRLAISGEPSDHMADALVTAAGLRRIAGDSKYWHPSDLSSKVRRTEGWIFGLA